MFHPLPRRGRRASIPLPAELMGGRACGRPSLVRRPAWSMRARARGEWRGDRRSPLVRGTRPPDPSPGRPSDQRPQGSTSGRSPTISIPGRTSGTEPFRLGGESGHPSRSTLHRGERPDLHEARAASRPRRFGATRGPRRRRDRDDLPEERVQLPGLSPERVPGRRVMEEDNALVGLEPAQNLVESFRRRLRVSDEGFHLPLPEVAPVGSGKPTGEPLDADGPETHPAASCRRRSPPPER